ncbi:MAG TPA: STN domain-containing protein, partial [Chitinophagaceae bacterium]
MPEARKKKILSLRAGVSLLFLLFFCSYSAEAQKKNSLNSLITFDVTEVPLQKLLSIIEQQTTYRFAYDAAIVEQQKRVTLKVSNISLNKLLTLLFKDSNIEYSIVYNQIVLKETLLPGKITISGTVNELQSGELLNGTSIYIPGLKAGTVA